MKKFLLKVLLLSTLGSLIILTSCQTEKKPITIEDVASYFNENEYEKALKFVEQILDENPKDYFAWTIKGRSLFALNKPVEGIEAMNQAIKLNPEYFQAFAYRSTMYQSMGENKKALDDINIAIKNDDKNMDLIRIKASTHYALGEYNKAIEKYTELINTNPKDYEALTYRAIANKKIQNYEVVLDDFEKAITANPNYAFAYEARADYINYVLKDNLEQAIEDYTKVIVNESENLPIKNQAYLYNNRGFAKYQKKDYDAAIEDINTSIKLFPENAYAFRNRALIHLAAADKTAMCQDLTKAKVLKFDQKYGQEVNEMIEKYCQ